MIPTPEGSYGSRSKGHTHVMRVITWTTEGPLRVVTACAWCSKTESVAPSRRIRNIPAGFSPKTWAEFLDKADRRLEGLSDAEKTHLKRRAAWLRPSYEASKLA